MAKVKKYDREGNESLVEVKVGDVVGFKSDYEQRGKIVKITRSQWGSGYNLTLENPDGFGGEYLRYATTTVERDSDCWID